MLLAAAIAFQGIRLAGASLQLGNLLHRDPKAHDTYIVVTHAGFTLIGWQIVAASVAFLIAAFFSAVLGFKLIQPQK